MDERLLALALRVERGTEVAVSAGIVWLEPERLAIGCHRGHGLTTSGQHHAQIAPGLRESWRQPDGLTKAALGLHEVAPLDQGQAEIVPGLGIAGLDGQRRAVVRDGRPRLTL